MSTSPDYANLVPDVQHPLDVEIRICEELYIQAMMVSIPPDHPRAGELRHMMNLFLAVAAQEGLLSNAPARHIVDVSIDPVTL